MRHLRNGLVFLGALLIGIVLLLYFFAADRCDLCNDYIGYESPTQPPQVLYRPSVVYTDAAREHRVKGVVRLRVLVDADGSVSKIEPIKTLPYGLTSEAIRSARGIEFYPAMSSRNDMVPG